MIKSESGSLPHNNVINGCHHSTCRMFRFTDEFECKPDITVDRKCPFLPHLPGYIVHMIAFLTASTFTPLLVLMINSKTSLSAANTDFYIYS